MADENCDGTLATLADDLRACAEGVVTDGEYSFDRADACRAFDMLDDAADALDVVTADRDAWKARAERVERMSENVGLALAWLLSVIEAGRAMVIETNAALETETADAAVWGESALRFRSLLVRARDALGIVGVTREDEKLTECIDEALRDVKRLDATAEIERLRVCAALLQQALDRGLLGRGAQSGNDLARHARPALEALGRRSSR